MVIIGLGRDDPRAWVRAAYLLLDAAQGSGPADKLPSQAEIAAKLGISMHTAGRAYGELAQRGFVHLVAGHGYFPGDGT